MPLTYGTVKQRQIKTTQHEKCQAFLFAYEAKHQSFNILFI